MPVHIDKQQKDNNQRINNPNSQQNNNSSPFQFIDNRPETHQLKAIQQMVNNSPQAQYLQSIQRMADNSPQAKEMQAIQRMVNNSPQAQYLQSIQRMADEHAAKNPLIQKKENKTGLPDNLKSGIENLSGHSMDDVKVHYNSAKPAQLNAHAYAQGTDIHLGAGQEKHLPHEAWHVVQQKQGRVKPTMQMKGGVNVNNDVGLEREADVMGGKALQEKTKNVKFNHISNSKSNTSPIQRVVYPNMQAMWAAIDNTQPEANILQIINTDAALTQIYADVTNNLAHFDFEYENGRQPEASLQPHAPELYRIHYGNRNELQNPYNDPVRFIGAILHEMMHITAALQYTTNVPGGSVGHGANMHLPQAQGQVAPNEAEFGLTDNQFNDPNLGAVVQLGLIMANWDNLETEAELDLANGTIDQAQQAVINGRVAYARVLPGALAHYDTVLTDLLYYMISEGIQQSRSYGYAHNMLTEANARRLGLVAPVAAIPRAPLPPPAPPNQTLLEWVLSFFR